MKVLFFFILVGLFSTREPQSYTGKWDWQNDRNSLTLELSQKDSIDLIEVARASLCLGIYFYKICYSL